MFFINNNSYSTVSRNSQHLRVYIAMRTLARHC